MRIHNLLGLFAAGVITAACGGGGNDENNSPTEVVILSGNNQNGSAGAALAQPITVQVNDKQGDAVKGADVTFAVTSGGGNVQTATVSTNNAGQAATVWTVGTTVGVANSATATVSGVTPATFTATVNAGAVASGILISGDAQTGAVGAALAQPVVAEFRDAFNNVAANVGVTWLVTAGGGGVSNPQLTTDAQGRVSTTWNLGLEFGPGQTLRVTGGAIGVTANATATLDAGAALVIASGDGQSAASGTALGAPLGVRVRTAASQNVAKVPVTWAVASGGGNLSAGSSLTATTGIATTNWTLGPAGGTQTVSATVTGTTPGSVTLSATSVVVAASTISGSITLSNSLLSSSSGRAGALRRSAGVRASGAQRPEFRLPSVSRVRNTRPAPNYVADELIVQLKRQAVNAPIGLRAMSSVATAQAVGQAMRQQLSRHVAQGRVSLTGVSPVILMARLKVSDRSKVDSVAQALAQDPAVASVGRNGWLRADGGPVRQGVTPNDVFYTTQSWNYSMVGLPRSWAITTGSSNVIVAVLDNGAVFFHPTIGAVGATSATGGGNYRNDGYDFVASSNATLCASQGGGTFNNAGDGDGYDPDPSTPDDRDPDFSTGLPCARSTLGSHGTHVAGTIGAKGNDGVAAVGVNWTVSIRPVRVLGIDGGSYFDIAQGVLYAGGLPADNGSGGMLSPPALPARIINMSLGGGCLVGSDPLHAAVQAITNPARPNGGVLVVVSAGNDATSVPSCPAAYDEVLAVGAVDPAGHRTTYSNFGSHVDIAAPGGDFPAPGGSVPDQSIGSFGILSTTCNFQAFPAACTPNHAFYVGTSMASPHVAGIAALLLANNAALTAADLRTRLLTYARPIDPSEQIGVGIANARNSLTQSMEPPHQVLVRAIDAATGVVAGSVTAAGGSFSIGGLPDGNYFVVAGEDDDADGLPGLPDRRYGGFGGVSSPTVVTVSSTAGAFANLTVGFPVEEEPNDAAVNANALAVDGAAQGTLSAADLADWYKIIIPSAGTYTFETTGVNGAFCGFALDVDTALDLLDSAQNPLQASADIDPSNAVRNFCSRISRALTAGTYFVKVSRDEVAQGVPSNGRYILQARSGP